MTCLKALFYPTYFSAPSPSSSSLSLPFPPGQRTSRNPPFCWPPLKLEAESPGFVCIIPAACSVTKRSYCEFPASVCNFLLHRLLMALLKLLPRWHSFADSCVPTRPVPSLLRPAPKRYIIPPISSSHNRCTPTGLASSTHEQFVAEKAVGAAAQVAFVTSRRRL